jgi:TctA family transporter
MLEASYEALQHIASPWGMVALISGTMIGMLSGAMPGGTLPTLVVLLGFAYTMDPAVALPLATGMIATINTGDTLPAVLLGIPGSATGQATILDGYPMSQQGRAGEALSAAYFTSMLGGVFGALFLLVTIPIARPLVLTFGSPEFFILGMVAISVVGVISSGAFLKGLASGAVGLLITSIGFDVINGTSRAVFGIDYLWDGIPLVPIVIGLFAVPELIDLSISDRPIARGELDELLRKVNQGRRAGIQAVLHNIPLMLRSSGLGILVGILPGIGGSLANWLTYANARQTVPGGAQTFGTGDVRGVIAPESANNSVDGATLVPTLWFGVPGSVGMAIFLGFMIIMGLQPGPRMLGADLDLTLTIVFSLALANVLGTGIALVFSPTLARIAFLRPGILVPLVLAVLMITAFQASVSIGDLLAVLTFAAMGFFMKTHGWPRPPIIIAVVLGSTIERFYFLATQTYGISMLWRPGFLGIVIVAAATAGYTVWIQRSVAAKATRSGINVENLAQTTPAQMQDPGLADTQIRQGVGGTSSHPRLSPKLFARRLRPGADGLFAIFLFAVCIYFLAASASWVLESALFPMTASIAGLVLLSSYFLNRTFRRADREDRAQLMDIGRIRSDLAPSVIRRRLGLKAGSLVGLVGCIWLFGFHVSIPTYVFLYLRFIGRVRWWVAAIPAVLFEALLMGFYDRLLHTTWHTPILFPFLGS